MPERTMNINRVKPQKWMAKHMAKFADEPEHRIHAWKHCGVLNNESSFTESFLALVAHELRRNEIFRLAGSTSRLAGILGTIRSILCVIDLDAAMNAPDPMKVFVANLGKSAADFDFQTEEDVLDWKASMMIALQGLMTLASGIDNVGDCWIYIDQDEGGRDRVHVLDGDPDEDGTGILVISDFTPRFAPCVVAMNVREMLQAARGRMN